MPAVVRRIGTALIDPNVERGGRRGSARYHRGHTHVEPPRRLKRKSSRLFREKVFGENWGATVGQTGVGQVAPLKQNCQSSFSSPKEIVSVGKNVGRRYDDARIENI